MATRLRGRNRRRATPVRRRLRSADREAPMETQVVDLTCTADEEVYDLTGISESPIMLAEHTPIVIADTPVATRPLRQTAENELSDITPFQLPDNEIEELPTFPFVVSDSSNRTNETQTAGVSCPVCLDSLVQIRARNTQLVSTKCGHVFCQQCVNGLLKDRTTCPCPTCRKSVSKKTVHPIYL